MNGKLLFDRNNVPVFKHFLGLFFLVDDGVDVLGLVSCEGAVNLFE